MMRSVCVVVVAGIFFLLPANLMGQKEPTVQLAGLRVVGPGYGSNGTELQAFHLQSGTALALAVQAPENKKIVEVDDSECSLMEFTDDRGQNLLDGISWGGFPQISEDGHVALVEVTSKNRPSQNASRLLAKGTIHVRVATSESTQRIDDLKLKVGTKVHVRQEVIEVMTVQKENDGLTVVLQISRTFKSNMKDIRFHTSNGKPLGISGRGSFTFGNAAQMEYNLETTSTPKALKVEIDLWQGLETLDLPFAIESGLGL
jgi:hypothetical protein